MKKIALEEALTAPGLERYLEKTLALVPSAEAKVALTDLLEDNANSRIASMDDAGVDIFVLSHTSPGVQAENDAATAVALARSANDYLHAQVQLHPDRYRAFAHLALQDVAEARKELERCVKELGFVGALINGNTNGVYLDDSRYYPFWETVLELGVPVYIHPADPYVQPYVIEGYSDMQGAVWGWSVDNSTHFLRLVLSGLFDRYPALTFILGHMGETLPYFAWRIDKRIHDTATAKKIARKPSEYLRSNLLVTTAGCCQDSALLCAIAELGDDRVLFSVDYPYENAKEAADWIDRAPIPADQHEKICHLNAERVLKL
ncbi:MAG TPA: amidohydrolase family protein [Candidatus Cybelea sp.]|nr:amidohydrolase family protein [Candidatus Cybelea sp.]